MESIDREPPIAFLLSGDSFLKSAIFIHDAVDVRKLRLRFEMPVYYLYSHAIELTLKAFLRAQGVTAKDLAGRHWGHDLNKLWNGCIERGLVLTVPNQLEAGAVIDALSSFATTYEFRYVRVGIKKLPTLDTVRETAQTLQLGVSPAVNTTVGEPIPNRE